MGRGPATIPTLVPISQCSFWGGETEALLGRRKFWAGKSRASLHLTRVHPWGFGPGVSPPLLKPSGDWFINHGIFMATSSLGGGGAAPKQRSAVPAEFQVAGLRYNPISLLFLTPVLPFLVVPKALPAAPKGAGDPRWDPSPPSALRGRLFPGASPAPVTAQGQSH